VNEVGGMAELIAAVSAQTWLLALNATMEGTRAGPLGDASASSPAKSRSGR
jgi:methyl-accepting chemotaxis protein